jgi:hypothetical protein
MNDWTDAKIEAGLREMRSAEDIQQLIHNGIRYYKLPDGTWVYADDGGWIPGSGPTFTAAFDAANKYRGTSHE